MLVLLLALTIAADAAPQDTKPVPKDSVEIVTQGCLKGRVFTATGQPEAEGARRGPDVIGRQFRAAGPKDVMALVKKNDGHLVEVVGVVRKTALADEGMGMRVGDRTRVVIGQPSMDPTRRNVPTAPNVPVMDVIAVRYLSDDCPFR